MADTSSAKLVTVGIRIKRLSNIVILEVKVSKGASGKLKLEHLSQQADYTNMEEKKIENVEDAFVLQWTGMAENDTDGKFLDYFPV